MDKTDIELVKKNLQQERDALKTYLMAKFVAEDWHGVQDAASDLRDVDSELKGLNVSQLQPYFRVT